MSKFHLTAARRNKLRSALKHCREARLYRRLLAVLEVGAGRPVAVVARSLGVARQSVHHWLRAYADQPTPETLCDQPHPGRPTRCDEQAQVQLHSLLAASPREFGFVANVWTAPLLQEYWQRWHDCSLGENTLRRWLHELGYTWKRSRYVLAPDPELEKKTANSS